MRWLKKHCSIDYLKGELSYVYIRKEIVVMTVEYRHPVPTQRLKMNVAKMHWNQYITNIIGCNSELHKFQSKMTPKLNRNGERP
jgi:hypothetical protein